MDDFDETAPKEVRNGRLVCSSFYENDTQKAVHQGMKAGEIVDGAQYVNYQLVESPSVLVAHRDFLVVNTTKNISEGTTRWIVANKSIPFPGEFSKLKSVHSEAIYGLIFEEEKESTKVTSWIHVDPCGNVPAMLFNLMLDEQMAFVIAMKTDLEK